MTHKNKRVNNLYIKNKIIGTKGIVPMGCGEVMAVNTFPHVEISKTEAAAAYALTYDDSDAWYKVSSSSSGSYSNNYQLFPDTEAVGDAAYFGASTPFGALWFNVSGTNATYSDDSVTWEYYNGSSWQTLSILYDQTDSDDQDGDRPFQEDGYIIFSAPDDWTPYLADSGGSNEQDGYFVRARISGANVTQIPLLDSKNHYTMSATNATKMPYDGTIDDARISWTTVSGSNNDTKVILCNLTNGKASAVKTITQAEAACRISSIDVDVYEGDYVALFCTQEDGGTEYEGGIGELTVSRN